MSEERRRIKGGRDVTTVMQVEESEELLESMEL